MPLEGSLAVFLSGSHSPKPACVPHCQKRKTKEVEHMYLLCTRLLDRSPMKILLTKEKFFSLFILQNNLAAFRLKTLPTHSPSLTPPL